MYPGITEITERLHCEFISASGSNSSRFIQKFDYALIVESDRGLITKQSDENLRFIIILKQICGILRKTLKMCWSKLRDQTKTGSQQIEQQQQKKRQTFEFPEVSSGGGKEKKRDDTCVAEKEEDRKTEMAKRKTWKEEESTWRKNLMALEEM